MISQTNCRVFPEGYVYMKKIMLIVVLVVLLMTPLFAAERHTGLGVGATAGFPGAAATARYDLDGFRVFASLSAPYVGSGGIYLDGGALLEMTEFALGEIPFFVDLGGQLSIGLLDSKFYFSVNALASMSWYVETMPLEVFFYLAPGIQLLSNVDLDIKTGVGAVYYIQ